MVLQNDVFSLILAVELALDDGLGFYFDFFLTINRRYNDKSLSVQQYILKNNYIYE